MFLHCIQFSMFSWQNHPHHFSHLGQFSDSRLNYFFCIFLRSHLNLVTPSHSCTQEKELTISHPHPQPPPPPTHTRALFLSFSLPLSQYFTDKEAEVQQILNPPKRRKNTENFSGVRTSFNLVHH